MNLRSLRVDPFRLIFQAGGLIHNGKFNSSLVGKRGVEPLLFSPLAGFTSSLFQYRQLFDAALWYFNYLRPAARSLLPACAKATAVKCGGYRSRTDDL
ncbi:MAG: hypothetical protein H6560_13345 [Lewinellaceae bacterium]|nr:hypothetical protein [Lewinellaceae bacterium]